MRGLVVDLFAGGGGASIGLEVALGRPVDIALNHDRVALAAHKANHPHTAHLEADVWSVDPLDATGGRPVDVLWASPDCTHFSVAKGGKPVEKKIRSLANAVVRWASATRPPEIYVENVYEFQGWGPLHRRGARKGKPIKARAGEFFRRWKGHLVALGYVVEHRILDASLFGAPTRRRRLFIVARCDGLPIQWPTPTHGPGRLPLHTAAECIDWSLTCRSIFGRKKPLAEKTHWRIAQGIKRFVLENPAPFVIQVNNSGSTGRSTHTWSKDQPLRTITGQNGFAIVDPFIAKVNHGKREARVEPINEPLSTVTATQRGHALVAPTLVQSGYGERSGQRPRSLDLQQPLGTIVADGQKHALVAAWMAKHFGDPNRTDGGGVVIGDEIEKPVGTVTTRDHHSLAAVTLAKFNGNAKNGHPGCAAVDEPLPTITSGGGRGGGHVAEVRAFLTAYYSTGTGHGQQLDLPLRTITAKHRLGLVTVAGIDYQIVDIGMRMLEPHELLRAQFGRHAATYDISAAHTKALKVRLIGNSVPPELVEALVRANVAPASEQAA